MRKMNSVYSVGLALAAVLVVAYGASAQMKPPMMPKMATVKGTLVDMTCSSKAYAMGMKWASTKEDHMLEDGKMQTGCATMCLKGGQPAALFSGDSLTAVLACDPKQSLAAFSSKDVELQGYWAGDGKSVKSFVPQKIRAGSGAWSDVACAEIH